MPKRILVTGSRTWQNADVIGEALADEWEPGAILIHGDCRGADRMAEYEWVHYACPPHLDPIVESYPADWNRYGKRAGHVRNAEMVDLGADVCLAFIRDGSRGASACAALATKAGIPVKRFYESSEDE